MTKVSINFETRMFHARVLTKPEIITYYSFERIIHSQVQVLSVIDGNEN